MSTKYKATIPDAVYFVTITTVEWIDVFIRPAQKFLLIDSLSYCQEHKGLKIYAFCIMSNHIHMICQADEGRVLCDIMRDFKKHTSKQIVRNIIEYPESRRRWMLDIFKKACSHLNRNQTYKVWQNGYHAEIVFSDWFLIQKLNYIHNNPVAAQIVEQATEYIFSSAKNYANMGGILDIEIYR